MRKKLIAGIVIVLIFAVAGYGIYYVNDYYHADDTAVGYLNGSGNVKVITTSNGLLLDGAGNDTALIFYPGAKVEYTSYLPLLMNLANQGIDCYLVEMPFNLAFLGFDSADEIIDAGNYSHYFLAGHSLGGVAASSYVHNNNRTDGLILFAAYPTEEIDKPVLSIYGSEDKVLDIEKYNESKSLMDNLTEFVVDGGNHGQVGNYGNQQGDGFATISSQNQQKQSDEKIIEFIDAVI